MGTNSYGMILVLNNLSRVSFFRKLRNFGREIPLRYKFLSFSHGLAGANDAAKW